MKIGVLKRHTFIHSGNLVVKVRKGTEVHAEGGVLSFDQDQNGMRIIRAESFYYLYLWDSVRAITLPQGGAAPYPLSML